jgi:putative N6-adenine-specific DNA methylase
MFTGCSAWIISSSREGFDKIGLKPSQKIKMINGSLECEFREYQIFGGTYSQHKKDIAEGKKEDRREKRGPKKENFKREFEKKDKEKKSYRFDDRKAPKATEQKPKVKGGKFVSEKRVKPAPKPTETFEKGKRELHGDEFVSKFVTFRQPTMIDDATTENKQFRKRKNKE